MKQLNHGSLSLSAALLLTPLAYGQPVGRDFNNDGTLDYPVSITEYNETTLPKGAARVWSGASKQAIQTIVASDPNTLFGYSIESAGDINADGFDDFIVGEPLWGYPNLWHGRIHIYSGQDGSLIRSIIGPYPEIGLGRYVAGIGDWNGDGTPDVASSAWVTVDTLGIGSTDDGYGIVFVFSGSDGSTLAEITDSTATDRFGFGVFGLGDVNGDGKSDIAITDPTADGSPGSGASGIIYVYEGSATPNLSMSFADASETILNSDPSVRTFAAQIDTMHPNRWLNKATIQVLSLTTTDLSGGVATSEFSAEILELDGTFSGSKGVRPQLLDPGDIDMNGVVDADDVQASAGQYGTSPNINGVMPVADINKDGVVDAMDVQTVLQGFGSTSNILEDLWDDTRLRAIAGAASGFGAHPNGLNITPAGGFQSHPIDDCPPSVVAGPDNGESVLPYLLGLDAQNNCPQCPACDVNDVNDCYDCSNIGYLTGGDVSVDDPSPVSGQTVIFTIEPISWLGNRKRCQGGGGCGNSTRTCLIEHPDTTPAFEVEYKDANGDWLPLAMQRWSVTTDPQNPLSYLVSVTGLACEEIRVRSINIRHDADCGTVEHERMRAVSFNDFEIETETQTSAPDGTPDDRKTVGLLEKVEFASSDNLPKNWVATWYYEGEPVTATKNNSISWIVSAPRVPGTMTVKATTPGVSNCESTMEITAIAPTSAKLEQQCERHLYDYPSSGFLARVKVGPDHVVFDKLRMREGPERYPAVALGIFSSLHGSTHTPQGVGSLTNTDSQNYFPPPFLDCVHIYDPNPGPILEDHSGFFMISINWEYVVFHPLQPFTREYITFDYMTNIATSNFIGDVTNSKGGSSVTKARLDPHLGGCAQSERFCP